MFAEFQITSKTDYKARICSLTSLLSLTLLVIALLLTALLSFDKMDFFTEINKTVSFIDLSYQARFFFSSNTDGSVINYPDDNGEVYAFTRWENESSKNLLSLYFDIYGVSSTSSLELGYLVTIRESEFYNVYYEDQLRHSLSNLSQGELVTLYCKIGFVQNYIIRTSKLPRSLIVQEMTSLPSYYRAGLPFRYQLSCNSVVEKTTNKYIGINVRLYKDNTNEIKYEVGLFELIRMKWKRIVAAGIIFFYLVRRVLKDLADKRVLDVTKKVDSM